jgi:single-strand DNA-binding protein
MNRVFLIGRLTKEPEIRTTQSGLKVASFSLAINEGKNKEGQEIVQYFNLSAWDRLAEIVEQYVTKGVKVAVLGSLKNRSWDKPDGTKGYATDITAKELEILSTRNESQSLSEQSKSENAGVSGSNPNDNDPNVDKPKKSTEIEELPEIDIDDISNIQMPF